MALAIGVYDVITAANSKNSHILVNLFFIGLCNLTLSSIAFESDRTSVIFDPSKYSTSGVSYWLPLVSTGVGNICYKRLLRNQKGE